MSQHCLFRGLFNVWFAVLTVRQNSFKQIEVKVYRFKEIALAYLVDWPNILEMPFLD